MVEGEGHDTFDRMDLDSLMHYQLNIMVRYNTLDYFYEIQPLLSVDYCLLRLQVDVDAESG